ncbi:MAG TPA: metal ABC transporter substrate-binding protein [Syntrophorhabdaceae bacterium]|mgnify:CR=1 FL=1|nr:metal ABC transporter substrate-binding protein [Syntrophorhabdaceae bacterium]
MDVISSNRSILRLFIIIVIGSLFCLSSQCSPRSQDPAVIEKHIIITSDTILGSILSSLLPGDRYRVESIIPPGQCPGHYDIKLSDLERIKKAELIIYFKGMSFMAKIPSESFKTLVIDTEGNNCMTPDYYIYSMTIIADNISRIFPDDARYIWKKKENEIKRLKEETDTLKRKIQEAGFSGKKIIASSMQRQPLEWMGFTVVADYGRPEAITAKDAINLIKIGKRNKVVLVVDNLQSGPDTGRAIAESLDVPHVVLTNFPSEKGYIHTLKENVEIILKALKYNE